MKGAQTNIGEEFNHPSLDGYTDTHSDGGLSEETAREIDRRIVSLKGGEN